MKNVASVLIQASSILDSHPRLPSSGLVGKYCCVYRPPEGSKVFVTLYDIGNRKCDRQTASTNLVSILTQLGFKSIIIIRSLISHNPRTHRHTKDIQIQIDLIFKLAQSASLSQAWHQNCSDEFELRPKNTGDFFHDSNSLISTSTQKRAFSRPLLSSLNHRDHF